MRRLISGLTLVLLLPTLLVAQELSADLEQRARKLEGRIMAPCC